MEADLLGEFIDAAVQDPQRARELLGEYPELIESGWMKEETPLHFLAVEGHEEAVRFLVECGANVNVTNKFGDSVLSDVVVLGNERIAAVLLKHGADPNAKSPTRDNVLDAAVRSGNPRLVELLLQSGARADYETDLGETIHDAVPRDAEHRGPILEVLAKHGISTGG